MNVDDPDAPIVDRAKVREAIETIYAKASASAAENIARLAVGAADEAVQLRASSKITDHFADRFLGPTIGVQIANFMAVPEQAMVQGKQVPSISIGGERLSLPQPAAKKLPAIIRPEADKVTVKQSFGIEALANDLPPSPSPQQFWPEPLKPKSPSPRPAEPHAKIVRVKD